MSLFGQTLVYLRQRSGYTREQLALLLGISSSHIKRLETDYIEPDEKTIEQIAEFFSVTPSYLTGTASRQVMVNEPGFPNIPGNFVAVPVLSTDNATKRVIEESEIIRHIILPVPGNKRCEYVGVLIDDNTSGCDRMKKGDVAIVEITNQLYRNDLVAVSYKGGSIFFKRYSRLGPTVILSSDNALDTITYDISDSDYNIIGKVIGFHGLL